MSMLLERSGLPLSKIHIHVGVFGEFLETGESVTQDARRKAKRLAELGLEGFNEGSELLKKFEELDNQTVEIDAEPIHIGEVRDALWSLSEEQLSAFLPFMDGDMSLLDFPYESE